MKILASVGSTGFKFDRLFTLLDELVENGVIKGKDLIAQTGKIDYQIKNFENFDFASYEKMMDLITWADVVVCHSGTGTVINSLKRNKKVIVVPRLKKYKEHESDHQLDLASAFASDGYVLVANDYEQLKHAIENIENFTPKKFVSNNENFVSLINELI